MRHYLTVEHLHYIICEIETTRNEVSKPLTQLLQKKNHDLLAVKYDLEFRIIGSKS
jgi:hypothetical protein